VIVVVRIGKDGNLKNSRPCNHCLEMMINYKIKKVMYSTDSGEIVSEKPSEMDLLHISSGWKNFNKLITIGPGL